MTTLDLYHRTSEDAARAIVTNVRAASFPSAPQARAVTATAARPNGPTADRPGQLER